MSKPLILLVAMGLYACGGSAVDAPVEAGAAGVVDEAAVAVCARLKSKCGDGCCEGLTCIDHYCAPPGEPGVPTPTGDE